MGSRLIDVDSGKAVWPGSVLDLLTGLNFDRLALPVEGGGHWEIVPSIEPGGLFHDIAGQDFYEKLTDTLNGPGGYDCKSPTQINTDTNCVLFSWDWRKDLVKAAEKLNALVDRFRELRNDPDLRVDIVAHSAGGLIARYFLRYGGDDVLKEQNYRITDVGSHKVRKAILIGTPNFGSISALQQAIKGLSVGPARMSPGIVATMPGLYQLLPHPDRTWMIDMQGRRIERDLYDPEAWRQWKWSIFDPGVRKRISDRFQEPVAAAQYLEKLEQFFVGSLERGARFHRALSVRQLQPPNTFIIFGGDCHLTPARCALEYVDGEPRVRLHPDKIRNPFPGVDYEGLMLEPGDGTVTKASLMGRDNLDTTERAGGLFPIDFAVFLCERHFRLAGNMTFRDNLLNILLY
ncbi:MAG: hypothetical protein MAG794_00490 [Gammaproteobacteria bacterium]|nr:hypothetical protein [Gammaproteobacteria bacterium]